MINYPIRILHVIGIMDRGGAETMIMNLYRNIDRSKIQFDFVENTNKIAVFDEEIKSLGGRIYNCPHYNGKNHFAYKKWWDSFFKKHQNEYRIVHGHIGSTASIYLKKAKKYGLFTIAHSHSSGGVKNFKYYAYKLLSYNTRNISDYFFGCSRIAAIDRFGKKVSNSPRCTILNNAIDTGLYRFNPEVRKDKRNEFNVGTDLLLGHIGRFSYEKNHRFILDVFFRLLDINKGIKLILVGDGPLKSEMIQYSKDIGIFDRVIFTGIRSDVNEIIQAMDIFIFPSMFEGLPVTLVEIQTSGLRCLMSDKVPTEAILTEDLIFIKKLSEPPEVWAKELLSLSNYERKNCVDEIKSHKYDIKETSKWLEDFYFEKYNK